MVVMMVVVVVMRAVVMARVVRLRVRIARIVLIGWLVESLRPMIYTANFKKSLPESCAMYIYIDYSLFDFFLPKPSLSTTFSFHDTTGRLRGPPRRRNDPTTLSSAPESLSSAESSSRGWLSCITIVLEPSLGENSAEPMRDATAVMTCRCFDVSMMVRVVKRNAERSDFQKRGGGLRFLAVIRVDHVRRHLRNVIPDSEGGWKKLPQPISARALHLSLATTIKVLARSVESQKNCILNYMIQYAIKTIWTKFRERKYKYTVTWCEGINNLNCWRKRKGQPEFETIWSFSVE